MDKEIKNLKPSERIKELHLIEEFNKYPIAKLMGFDDTFKKAVLNYLDEEWEKNRPCKHLDTYQVDGYNDVYYNVCNDCGVLFLAGRV